MKTFQEFCAEMYTKGIKPGSQRFSDLGGHAALKAGGGKAALRTGSSIEDVLHAGKRATQQKEGPYISPETKARTNLMNAQAERLKKEPVTKKPMDDFAAGGGAAKMKANPGMTRDQVIALGKKNLANQK
jgi:hypothetical protein